MSYLWDVWGHQTIHRSRNLTKKSFEHQHPSRPRCWLSSYRWCRGASPPSPRPCPSHGDPALNRNKSVWTEHWVSSHSHLSLEGAGVWCPGSAACSAEAWSRHKHLGDGRRGPARPCPRRIRISWWCCCCWPGPCPRAALSSDWPSPGSSASDWSVAAPPRGPGSGRWARPGSRGGQAPGQTRIFLVFTEKNGITRVEIPFSICTFCRNIQNILEVKKCPTKNISSHACLTTSWQPSRELPGVAVRDTPSSLNESD